MKKAYGRDMRVGSRKVSRRKLGANERAILSELTHGDMLVGFLLSCKSIKTMYRVASQRAHERARGVQRARETLARLQKKGLLEIIEGADSSSLHLTALGKDELQFATSRTPQTDTWDGMWRLVTYDIPNTNEQLRQEVSRLLQTIGYLQVQKSVYVYPYDVPALTRVLHSKKFLSSQLIVCVVTALSDDKHIKKYFKIPT